MGRNATGGEPGVGDWLTDSVRTVRHGVGVGVGVGGIVAVAVAVGVNVAVAVAVGVGEIVPLGVGVGVARSAACLSTEPLSHAPPLGRG